MLKTLIAKKTLREQYAGPYFSVSQGSRITVSILVSQHTDQKKICIKDFFRQCLNKPKVLGLLQNKLQWLCTFEKEFEIL